LCEIAGQRLRQRAPARAIEIGASITLALRPEKIGVARARVNAESENGLRARITRISYFGSVLEIQVDAGSIGQLTIHAPAWRNESEYEIGQMIWLNWPEDAAVIVKREGAAIST
jgi:ABC-type Fe3+/spermidine/putrescine transport system ATPase subunit